MLRGTGRSRATEKLILVDTYKLKLAILSSECRTFDCDSQQNQLLLPATSDNAATGEKRQCSKYHRGNDQEPGDVSQCCDHTTKAQQRCDNH